MRNEPISALLIEDNPGFAVLVEAMAVDGEEPIAIHVTSDLDEGLERAAVGGLDAVLVDLSLPGTDGLDAVRALRDRAPGVAIIALATSEEEALAVDALAEGAHDYLLKHELDARSVQRALRYAVERRKLEASAAHAAPAVARVQPGGGSLKHAIPRTFDAWAGWFGDLLENIDDDPWASAIEVSIRALAGQLAGSGGGAGDVLELSAAAVAATSTPIGRDTVRVMELRVLGGLADHYRTHGTTPSVAAGGPAAEDRAAPEPDAVRPDVRPPVRGQPSAPKREVG